MAGKLLVTFLGLLLVIPNHGNPVPEKDTLSDNKTENKEESPKTESVSTEKPTDITSKSNEVSQSTTSKPEELPKVTQTTKKAITTTPEPDVEEDEDQVYFILPKGQKSNQVFKPQQPFYFNPNAFQQQQPRFTFNQPKTQMPFSYPMMFQPMLNPPHSNTNNFMNFDSQPGMFDGSTMFSMPQSHGWPFGTNTDHRNNGQSTLFLPRAHSWYGGMVDPMYSKQIANHYL